MTDLPLTKLAVKAILERASAHPWSLQGMGMFRLYLSREVRLHVWDMRFTVERVSTVHTHPWDFESNVLSGCITDRIYANVEGCDPTHYRQQIVCGPGGGTSAAPEPVAIRCIQNLTHITGEAYSRAHDEIHESVPKSGTVTLLRRVFHEDTEHAHVYYAFDRSWISAEPRDATEQEVLAMARMALDRWES